MVGKGSGSSTPVKISPRFVHPVEILVNLTLPQWKNLLRNKSNYTSVTFHNSTGSLYISGCIIIFFSPKLTMSILDLLCLNIFVGFRHYFASSCISFSFLIRLFSAPTFLFVLLFPICHFQNMLTTHTSH